MKRAAYVLLAIIMVAVASGDTGASLWKGKWLCDYDGEPVYLVIASDSSAKVTDMAGNLIAELQNGKVSADGETYTAQWTAPETDPDVGDVAFFKAERETPTKFKGSVSWEDGEKRTFNGELAED